MHRVVRSFVVGLSLVAVLLLPTAQAFAATDPYDGICKSGGADSTVCKRSGGNPLYGPDGFLLKITNIISIIAGAAAVIVIVGAGIRFIAGNGDSEQIAKAKRAIMFATAGLLIIVLGRLIISTVLRGIG